MYERMLDKNKIPTTDEIKKYIGESSYKRLLLLESYLENMYLINKELKFPFGSSYGWGYKYSHKTKHLFYLFFEDGALTLTTQIGDKEVELLLEEYKSFSQKAKSVWDNRYPCGENGGWVHYRILEDNEIEDVLRFLKIRKKPQK